MFDSRKIDAFFDGEKQLKRQTEENKLPISGWSRFVKLGFPCIAALLLGLMLVMLNIRKSVDLRDNDTLPRKQEMEKLHLEEIVFSSVDAQNRVNKVVADSVDEVESGSQKVKFMRPRGTIPTNDGEIKIVSKYGYFTQDDNILELYENVKAVINGDTKVNTAEVIYDFNSEFGYGKKSVKAVGSWGTLKAPRFTYDKKNGLLTLIGHNVITNGKGVITSKKETRIYQNENKIISVGRAVLRQDDRTVHANEVSAFFNNTGHKELKRVDVCGKVMIRIGRDTARGAVGYFDAESGKVELFRKQKGCGATEEHVYIRKEDNLLTADHIIAYVGTDERKELQKAEAFGNVLVTTPKGSARGKRGIYDPQKNIVQLFDDVRIEQDGNFIDGAYAETDLNTSISRIRGNEKTKGRISGIFYKKRKEKK